MMGNKKKRKKKGVCTLSGDLCVDLQFQPECEEKGEKRGRELKIDGWIKGISGGGYWGERKRKEDRRGGGALQSATVFT